MFAIGKPALIATKLSGSIVQKSGPPKFYGALQPMQLVCKTEFLAERKTIATAVKKSSAGVSIIL